MSAVLTALLTSSGLLVSFRFVLGSDSLTISEVTESDEGLYTCIVNTTLDHVSATAKLTVVGRFRPLQADAVSLEFSLTGIQM